MASLRAEHLFENLQKLGFTPYRVGLLEDIDKIHYACGWKQTETSLTCPCICHTFDKE